MVSTTRDRGLGDTIDSRRAVLLIFPKHYDGKEEGVRFAPGVNVVGVIQECPGCVAEKIGLERLEFSCNIVASHSNRLTGKS